MKNLLIKVTTSQDKSPNSYQIKITAEFSGAAYQSLPFSMFSTSFFKETGEAAPLH